MRMICMLVFLQLANLVSAQVNYPIVFCSRPVNAEGNLIQDAGMPHVYVGNTDLKLLKDGVVSTLVDVDQLSAIEDPYVSFDAKWVYYTRVSNFGTFKHPKGRIEKVNIETKEIKTIIDWGNKVCSGPCQLPDNRVVFVGQTNHQHPKQELFLGGGRFRVKQTALFVCDDDGSNLERIGYFNLQAVMHPKVLKDGRIQFSTHESHGLRATKVWSQWVINPDGRKWEPLWSHLREDGDLNTLHGHCQTSDERLKLIYYYSQKNQGGGIMLDYSAKPKFGPMTASSNQPLIDAGRTYKFSFQPTTAKVFTPWCTAIDQLNGSNWKVAWPAPVPDNKTMVTALKYRMPGNSTTFVCEDAGIYIHPATASTKFDDLVKVIDTPENVEYSGVPVITYKSVFGVDQPATIPWLPTNSAEPYGFVGTSSVFVRETARVNKQRNKYYANGTISDRWGQGGDTTTYSNSDVKYVRILTQYAANQAGFKVTGNERMLILSDIPVESDGSFLAKIPADVSWTFQLLNTKKQALTQSFTWHQVRPGEKRTDCKGCHAHANPDPIDFSNRIAGQPGYQFTDLTQVKSEQMDYDTDIKPIVAKYNLNEADILNETGVSAIPFHSVLSTFANDSRLTADESLKVAKWIDTGKPQNTGGGLFTDEKEPTLFVHKPRRGDKVFSSLAIGSIDTQSDTITVKAMLNGVEVPLVKNGAVYTANVNGAEGWQLTVTSEDESGNVKTVNRKYVNSVTIPPTPDPCLEKDLEIARLRKIIADAMKELEKVNK